MRFIFGRKTLGDGYFMLGMFPGVDGIIVDLQSDVAVALP